MKIQKPRGTKDFWGQEMRLFKEIEEILLYSSSVFGFEQIKTPMFENTDLFLHNIGTGTDIVNKEMYTFEDKGGRSLTLRPELTAPAIRLYLENKLYAQNEGKQRLSYIAECFRYERPGVGRYRQFHQFGVELIGEANLTADIEVIELGKLILEKFDLTKNVRLEINSIGSEESRQDYRQDLVEYFVEYEADLCNDCKERLKTNPLRILDCKVDAKKEYFLNAPKIFDYLSEEEQSDLLYVLDYFKESDIEVVFNQNLVRGLDYYNDIIFEFVDKETNLAIIAGGRYNKLIGHLHKEDIPAVGFGLGFERLLDKISENSDDLIGDLTKKADIVYLPLVKEANNITLKSINKLRKNGLIVSCDFANKSLKSQLKAAINLNAVYAVIIGEEELAADEVTVRNLISKDQVRVKLSEFEAEIINEGA